MSANDVFGVIVRTVGLLMLVYGGWVLAFYLSGIKTREGIKRHPGHLVSGSFFVVAALILLYDADALVHSVYR
jgi:uncharacterized YccA/Bax inhibitor family protein